MVVREGREGNDVVREGREGNDEVREGRERVLREGEEGREMEW